MRLFVLLILAPIAAASLIAYLLLWPRCRKGH